VTVSSAALSWQAPADSPAPDSYQVLREGHVVGTVDGRTTTYRDTDLDPGTAYSYQVVATWGGNSSKPGDSVTVRTTAPPLSDARLAACALPVQVHITGVSEITNLRPGLSWTRSWQFTPLCPAGACDVQLSGDFSPPDLVANKFSMRLTRRGSVYTGTATAHLSTCRTVKVTDTLTIRLTVGSGYAANHVWTVGSFTGTLTMDSPLVEAGGGQFCPVSRIDSTIAGSY
jgi:hypothetical protein